MSEREFQLWKAVNRIYPFSSRAEEMRFGVLASLIKGDGSYPFEHFPGHFWMESDYYELLSESLSEIREKTRDKAKRDAERAANKNKPRR